MLHCRRFSRLAVCLLRLASSRLLHLRVLPALPTKLLVWIPVSSSCWSLNPSLQRTVTTCGQRDRSLLIRMLLCQCVETDSGAVSVTSPSYVLWDNPVSRAWSAPGAVHCWNCGGTGHLKDVCPLPKSGLTKGQIRRRRKFANRRIAVSVDTERIVTSARPFQAWVNALFEGVDCPADEKKVTVLPCAASDTRPEHDDGQACASGEDRQTQQLQRKMTWLVAIRGHKLETAMPWLCRR